MLTSLLILLVLGFLAWPYYMVYRLDRALALNDRREMEKLIDLESVRRQFKRLLDEDIEGVTVQFDNPVFKFLRGGVKELSAATFDAVDYDWIREAILTAESHQRRRPGIGRFSFACFESPTRFLIRAGELGKNPIHLYMTLRNWQWRVTALFV
jgi:hypothetical protein